MADPSPATAASAAASPAAAAAAATLTPVADGSPAAASTGGPVPTPSPAASPKSADAGAPPPSAAPALATEPSPAPPSASADSPTCPPSLSTARAPSAQPPSAASSRPASKEPGALRPIFPSKAFSARAKLTGEVNPFELSFSQPSAVSSPEFATTLASLQDGGNGRTTPGDVKPSLPPIGHITTPLEEREDFTWPLNTPAISSLRSGLDDEDDGNEHNGKGSLPTPASSALVQHALAFDTSNFVRTGLTPGTGMTPLTGCGPASFPPPSPNTAAFLAMVQNATASAASQMGGATGQTPNGDGGLPLMTPGTFNNVMSQLSQLEDGLDGGDGAGSGQPPLRQGGPPPPSQREQQQQQPDYFSHRPGSQQTHIQQQLAASGQHPPQPPHLQQQRSSGATVYAQHSGLPMAAHPIPHPGQPPPHPQAYPHPHPSQMPGQQSLHRGASAGSTGGPPLPSGSGADARFGQQLQQQQQQQSAQAANGLYLLSQAHHEIAKREQTDGPLPGPGPTHGQPPHMAYGGYPPPQMVPYHPGQLQQQQSVHGQGPPGPASTSGRKAKRKSSSETVPSAAGPPAKKGAGAKQPQQRSKKQMSEESDQLDDGTGGGGGSLDGLSQTDGRPETEEEKRKNFLERNRQAALKCRQRKKAWLNELQGKVEVLTAENEGLAQTVAKLTGEVHRLQAALAGAGGGVPPPQQGRMPLQQHMQQQQHPIGSGQGAPSGMVGGVPHPPPPPNGGPYPSQQQQQPGGPPPRSGPPVSSRPTSAQQPPHPSNGGPLPPSSQQQQQSQRLPPGQPAGASLTPGAMQSIGPNMGGQPAYGSSGPAQPPPVAGPPKVRV